VPSSPNLLSDLEQCPRKAYYSPFQPYKLSPREMTLEAINLALRQEESPDGGFGEVAGAAVMQLAEDRGLDTDAQDLYSRVIHIAALSDILVSAIRKPTDEPWTRPDPVQNWTSGAYLSPDGRNLRRICMVSHWSDERHYSECRSWFTLGEMSHYKLPMQIVVLVVGQERCGKRHTPWTSGYLHPNNHELRFRKRSKGSRSDGNVFNDRWEKIWREDHAEISRETWLNAMLKDDILRDVCFRVDVPVPPAEQMKRIREMAARKVERLQSLTEKPEPNLSGCDWPIPCCFRKLCHSIPEREPSEKNGFVRISHETCDSEPVSPSRQ